MKYYFQILFFLLIPFALFGQKSEQIPLYESKPDSTAPSLFVHLAKDNKNGASVIIIPGGGYAVLAIDHEGNQIANWFNERGVNAFILQYSLGKFDGTGGKHPDMLNDAKRAIRLVRNNSDKWNLNKNHIGVMGFSAGGHLAATLSTHFDDGDKLSMDLIERESSLPNFCILAYPVISMESEYTHWGSRRFLLGPTPSPELVHDLSNEHQVSGITPPTFIFHTSDDKVVPVQNSVHYYLALRKYGIPAEMHIFEHGRHGVGLVTEDPTLKQWSALLEDWLKRWKVIK